MHVVFCFPATCNTSPDVRHGQHGLCRQSAASEHHAGGSFLRVLSLCIHPLSLLLSLYQWSSIVKKKRGFFFLMHHIPCIVGICVCMLPPLLHRVGGGDWGGGGGGLVSLRSSGSFPRGLGTSSSSLQCERVVGRRHLSVSGFYMYINQEIQTFPHMFVYIFF